MPSNVPFEKGPYVDVLIPLGHSDGEVAQLVRRDVDSPGQQTIALLGGERPVVPDDVLDRIGHAANLSGLRGVVPGYV